MVPNVFTGESDDALQLLGVAGFNLFYKAEAEFPALPAFTTFARSLFFVALDFREARPRSLLSIRRRINGLDRKSHRQSPVHKTSNVERGATQPAQDKRVTQISCIANQDRGFF